MFKVYKVGGKNHLLGVTPTEKLLKPTSRIQYMFRKLVNQPDNTFIPYYIVCTDETDSPNTLDLNQLENALSYGRTDHFRTKLTSLLLKEGVENDRKVFYFAVGRV